ncbi:unnamed protein product [Symbiodinium natans]|uniref:AAA+ ATPase domain-containing protein n=1 Tax=Symbiodinium natans TaxID=878477 RepID=A0A812KG37_9DINO|nr:unnamed protein product [Symbiodinium natans]
MTDVCGDDNCCTYIGGSPSMQLLYAAASSTYAVIGSLAFTRDMAEVAGAYIYAPRAMTLIMYAVGGCVAVLWILMVASRCCAPFCCAASLRDVPHPCPLQCTSKSAQCMDYPFMIALGGEICIFIPMYIDSVLWFRGEKSLGNPLPSNRQPDPGNVVVGVPVSIPLDTILPLQDGSNLRAQTLATRKHDACQVTYKGSQEAGVLKVRFENSGGKEVKWLRPQKDGYYVGTFAKSSRELQVRAASANLLMVQFRGGPQAPWSKAVRYSRRNLPSAHQVLAVAKDPEKASRDTSALNYANCERQTMDACGWYLPPEWAADGLYKDLLREGDPQVVRLADFRFDARLEATEDHQRYLATYVGELDGSLSEKLANVSKLLDWTFDGLCVHRLDSLPVPHDFKLGVITGPSGSGKSSLAADVFGASPVISWSAEPVIAHFESLDRAREFLEAAHLDPSIAMRPYSSLSGGEQARADMARVLDLGCRDPKGQGKRPRYKALILDEFTSLVDRRTANAMAQGLQRLVQRRRLSKVVVVSCHSDFVHKSALEPDWLFECHSHRLLKFHCGEVPAPRPPSAALKAARAAAAAAEEQLAAFRRSLAQHAGHSCFSSTYRTEVAALAGALQVLGETELLKQRKALQDLEEGEKKRETEVQVAMPSAGPTAPSTKQTAEMPEVVSMDNFQIPWLRLEVRRALPREWVHFRQYHYKDHSLQTMAIVFVGLLDGRACGFCAIVPESHNWIQRNVQGGKRGDTKEKWQVVEYPKTWLAKENRRLFREHRTVVLPDFQGLGVAPVLCDCVANFLLRNGADFTSQTVHPFYGSYRDRSPFWRALPTSRQPESGINGNLKYSHVFVGAFKEDGYQDKALVQKLRMRVRCLQKKADLELRKGPFADSSIPFLT